MPIKSTMTAAIGLLTAAFGAWLRLAAHELAWPSSFSFSGPPEDTLWGIREHAYHDLGLVILVFGLLIMLLLLVHWLWQAPRHAASG